jgi:alkylation response protein AidB-like acyl-CoA dehydrogenase
MRFEVAETAATLRSAADALLRDQATPDLIRAGWPGGAYGKVMTLWRALAQVGVVGTLVPELGGGLGLDAACLVPLLEGIGYYGLPVPAVETIAVAAPLLAAANHHALEPVLNGTTLVAAMLDDGTLVPHGQHADLVLLRADHALRLYDRAELALEPVKTVDGARGLTRLLRSPAGGTTLADDRGTTEAAWQRGVLGTSAVLVGLAQRMLDTTVAYVKNRQQFGAPIGSFQAVKHTLADALLGLEFARPAVLAAGWAQATGQADAAEQTSMAKVLASDAATHITRAAIQCHGAMGYTTEYDLHLFAKRVWALVPSWGDPTSHRQRLARAIGLGRP